MDLISRQAAIDAIERKKDKTAKGEIGSFYNTIIQHDIDAIVELPSVQPERKTGEWEEIAVIADAYDISGVKTWASKMMCDQCGFTTIAIEGGFSQYNYCPYCGADMRRTGWI